jgi:hypothetical protein
MKTKQQETIHIENLKTTARGDRHYDIEEVDNIKHYTFGFSNLQIWIPKLQSWTNTQDKFYVTTTDSETVTSEFWAHWKAYIQKRFGLSYVPIEQFPQH